MFVNKGGRTHANFVKRTLTKRQAYSAYKLTNQTIDGLCKVFGGLYDSLPVRSMGDFSKPQKHHRNVDVDRASPSCCKPQLINLVCVFR